MESGIKVLSVAASLLFFVAVTVFIFGMFRTGESTVITQQNKSLESMSEIVSPNWTKYAGKIILGSEVKYLVNGDAAFYRVITKERLESFSTFDGINDATSGEYVDPSDQFVCKSIMDCKGNVVGLQFTETGTRNTNLVSDIILRGKLKTQLLSLQSEQSSISQDITRLRQELLETAGDEKNERVDNDVLTGYSKLLTKQSQLRDLEMAIEELQKECNSVQDKISEAVIGGGQ